MLLNVQDMLPEECRDAFKANLELTGHPSVGLLGVHGTSSVQINISAAGLNAGDNRLGSQLGDFGCEHFDRNDSPDHFTTMFSNPDIPEEYEPGAFHILQLGVFVVLRKFVGVTFSGRRRHVGTAPTPPLGFSDVPYAYRFNVVWYPKEAAVDGNSRWTLASLPGKGSATTDKQQTITKKGTDSETIVEHSTGSALELEAEDLAVLSVDEEGEQEVKKGADDPEPLYLTPEMINMDDKGAVTRTTNRATFARSGHILMDRQAHMNFMGRSLHQLTSYVWRQLPHEYGIHIDVDKLLGAITYTQEEDGRSRVPLLPWASAPNVGRVSQEREENQKIWSAYQAKVRRFIPHLAGRPLGTGAGGSAPLAVDSVDPESRNNTQVRRGTAAASMEVPEGEGNPCNEALHPSRNHKQEKGKQSTISGAKGGGLTSAAPGRKINSRKGKAGGEKQESKVAMVKGKGKGAMTKDSAEGKGREVRRRQNQAQDVSEPLQSAQNAGIPVKPSQLSASWREVPLHMAQKSDAYPSEAHAAMSKRHRGDDTADYNSHTKRPRLIVQEGHFPFIQGLGADVMRRELEEIDRELSLSSNLSIRDIPSTAFDVPHVLAASNALAKEPLSLVAPAHIRDLLTQVRLGVESDIAQAIDSRLRRYSVLVSSVRIWYWLDVTIRNSVRDLFNSSAGPTMGWLSAMVTVAKTCLEGKTSPLIRFDPNKYPALLALRSSAITVPNSCRKLFTASAKDQEELLKAVTQAIRSALMEALEFPQDASMKDRRRAWLLGTLVDTIGPCFLATRYAWNAWSSFVVKDYFSSEKMYKDDSDLILPFKRALQLHPICQDQSPTQILYHRFCRSFCEMASSAPRPDAPKTVSTLVEITSPDSQLDVRVSRLVDFLRACLGYIDGTLPAQHRVYQLLSRNLDYYLPFREKTPSKIRFNSPEGPFHKPAIRRTIGLFSALVFRGITYNTPYSRHPGSRMQFYGKAHVLLAVDAFKQRYPAEPTEDPHYFCNPNAYSRQPITGRALSEENLKSFWDKAAALDWVTQTAEILSFSKCLRLLTDANFPTMGTLQMFLLVADLHYAGVCSPPELSDVVDFINRRKPKGGSLKALASLGLIPASARPTSQQIESGLEVLDRHLRLTFTEEERSRMGYDLICLEHLLCKYQRAVNEEAA